MTCGFDMNMKQVAHMKMTNLEQRKWPPFMDVYPQYSKDTQQEVKLGNWSVNMVNLND